MEASSNVHAAKFSYVAPQHTVKKVEIYLRLLQVCTVKLLRIHQTIRILPPFIKWLSSDTSSVS